MQQAAENTVEKEGEPKSLADKAWDKLKLVGRFSRYDSIFAKLLLPFLSVKYLAEGLHDLTNFTYRIQHWKEKEKERTDEGSKLFGKYDNVGWRRWLNKSILALSFGTVVNLLIGLYTNRTYRDIKTLYREALGYEFDKAPQDIGVRDIWRSQNAVIQKTRGDFLGRTLKRFGAASGFFIPWGPWFAHEKYENTSKLDNIGYKMGPGVMGAYLFWDAFKRKKSFFEELQETVDTKLSRDSEGGKPGEGVTTEEILSLFLFQRKAVDKSYLRPPLDSQEWQEQTALAAHIADVTNRTYGNTPGDNASFTIGKFEYLFGFGLLDTFPESLAYVELASQYGMQAVKQVASAVKNGMNPETAFAEYGISPEHLASLSARNVSPQEQQGRFEEWKHTPEPESAVSRDPQEQRKPPAQWAEQPENASKRLPQTARKGGDYVTAQTGATGYSVP
jgi:hypothetical protein